MFTDPSGYQFRERPPMTDNYGRPNPAFWNDWLLHGGGSGNNSLTAIYTVNVNIITVTPIEGGVAVDFMPATFELEFASNGGGWDLNGDGILQKIEADNWWLNGKGTGITVDNSKIDWSGLKIPQGLSSGDRFAISTTDAFRVLPYETAATYGGTTFEVVGPSQVKVINQLYHYEYRPNVSNENIIRNIMTWLGKPLGEGVDFMIFYNNPIIRIK